LTYNIPCTVGWVGARRGYGDASNSPAYFWSSFFMFFLVAVSTQHGEASLAWAAHGAVALRKHLKHVIEIRHRHKKAHDFGCADGLLLASVGARAGGLSQSGNSVASSDKLPYSNLTQACTNPTRATTAALSFAARNRKLCEPCMRDVKDGGAGTDGEVFSACAADPERA